MSLLFSTGKYRSWDNIEADTVSRNPVLENFENNDDILQQEALGWELSINWKYSK